MKYTKLLSTSFVALAFIGVVGCGTTTQSTNPSDNTTTTAKTTTTKTAAAKVPAKKKAMDAKALVAALKSAGMPIGKTDVYSASNDPNKLLGRPGQYTSKVNFIDTRVKEPVTDGIEVSNGGSVEVFANQTDAKTRYEYVAKIAKSMPMLNEYDFRDGDVVLRISNSLTPTQEKKYEVALKKILG